MTQRARATLQYIRVAFVCVRQTLRARVEIEIERIVKRVRDRCVFDIDNRVQSITKQRQSVEQVRERFACHDASHSFVFRRDDRRTYTRATQSNIQEMVNNSYGYKSRR